MLLVSFLVLVLLPAAIFAGYLWIKAVDQYASNVGFTVRREEAPTAVDLIGGLSNLSSSSSSDSDVLYEFIQSQELIQQIDDKLDLRKIYSEHHSGDPLFTLKEGSNIEELLQYWKRMVQISYAPGTGLIQIKALAFTPQDAQNISTEIFEKSLVMINELSAVARNDTMRYATEELDLAIIQLKEARQALTRFRSVNQIVNPTADIQVQMGLLTTLQQQLGEELITFDLLKENIKDSDPRLVQSELKIKAIRARITEERLKLGTGGSTISGESYATLFADFERLSIDREFAEQKYTGALSNLDSARADARRQNRYLAAFIRPTLPESAEYPRRLLVLAVATFFLLAAWSILALIYYSLRDRR